MRFLFFIILALHLLSCATQSENLRARFTNGPQFKQLSVPFIAQQKYYCAPATLAMISQNLNPKKHESPEILVSNLADMLYTPKMKGTFQNDVIAATRRLGLIATPIDSLEKIIISINENIPVLIFQNLGLSWIPTWHYALVVGYDLNQNELILHSGKNQNTRMKIATFEKTWKRVDNWGLAIVNPGTLATTAIADDVVKATAGLELAGHLKLAQKSYLKILEKWNQNLGTLVGLGNIYYQMDLYQKAQANLERATHFHPKSFVAWYNYALLLIETKQYTKAQIAAESAISNADPAMKENYQSQFNDLLK